MKYNRAMEKTTTTKKRLLMVLSIFQAYSDTEHPISLDFVMQKLEEADLYTSKYALYDDIAVLNDMQHEIIFERNIGYHYVHPLTTVELKIVDDALVHLNSISEKKTEALSTVLLQNFSNYHKQSIINLSITNNQKVISDQVIYQLQAVLQAIQKNYSISFTYFDYDLTKAKKYRKNKQRYHLIPYAILLHNQFYYCIGYHSKYNAFQHYRIDKMDTIQLDSLALKQPFDVKAYTSRFIDMYIDQKTNITLSVENHLANVVIDRFNNQFIITNVNDTHFEINLTIDPSLPFLGWLFSFKKAIVVKSPQSLINTIQDTLFELSQLYFKD